MTDNTTQGPVTTDASGQPTKAPQPKVLAATGGSVLGGAVGLIGIYVLETTAKIDIPGPVEGAVFIVVSAILAFVAGYLKRPSANAS
jgi:hypothetical protein